MTTPTRAAIEHIIRDYKGPTESLAAYIVARLQARESIQRRTKAVLQTVEEAHRAYEEVKRKARADHATIQAECTHLEQEWNGDPSGGNDGYHRCPDCLKEW